MSDDSLWDMQQVADYLKLRKGTVKKKVQKNEIPFIRLASNCVRFRKKTIDEWLAKQTKMPVHKPLSLQNYRRGRGVA